MKRIWKDYFSFTKKERTAIIVLLVLMAVFLALPYFFSLKVDVPADSPALKKFLADNDRPAAGDTPFSNADADEYRSPGEYRERKITPFFFDPNLLPEDGWIRLGVSAKTAATIMRFRARGGRFREAADLKKIWGLGLLQAEQLMPYVQLAERGKMFGGTQPGAGFIKKPVAIDINTATAEEWKQLPGIGGLLSARIVAYRERANGFGSVAEVKKVYGISDSAFAAMASYLYVDTATVTKMDVNTVSQYALAQRTGITAAVARAIIVSRQQYGPYHTVDDLRRIVFINDSIFALIRPYITVRQ